MKNGFFDPSHCAGFSRTGFIAVSYLSVGEDSTREIFFGAYWGCLRDVIQEVWIDCDVFGWFFQMVFGDGGGVHAHAAVRQGHATRLAELCSLESTRRVRRMGHPVY